MLGAGSGCPVSAQPARERPPQGWQADAEWSQIEAAALRVAAVMHRHVRQLGTFLAPAASLLQGGRGGSSRRSVAELWRKRCGSELERLDS
jgi:hypothetical protein